MKILAIDPATKTGWAWMEPGRQFSGVWDLSVRKDESSGMRLIRLDSKLDEIYNTIGIDLLVFEAARGGMPGRLGALVVSAEIQGHIKFWCEKRGIDFRGSSPSEIKKWATGKGNAGKPLMVEKAKEKWPNVEIVDDNQADAMFLCNLAASEYGNK
jgi:Holliday junction resolvasome RuvABC endonuclease subunit